VVENYVVWTISCGGIRGVDNFVWWNSWCGKFCVVEWRASLHGCGFGPFHRNLVIEHWFPHNSNTPETMGCFSGTAKSCLIAPLDGMLYSFDLELLSFDLELSASHGIGPFHRIVLIEHWFPHNSNTADTMGCFSETANACLRSNCCSKVSVPEAPSAGRVWPRLETNASTTDAGWTKIGANKNGRSMDTS